MAKREKETKTDRHISLAPIFLWF